MIGVSMRFGSATACILFALYPTLLTAKVAFMHEIGEAKRIVVCATDLTQCDAVTPENKISLYPDFSSDGKHLAYVQGTDVRSLGVVVHDLTSNETLQIVTDVKGRALHPDFSGDGRYLAYSISEGSSPAYLQILGLDRKLAVKSERRLSHESASLYFPSLSSDGSFLVYQKDTRDGARVVMHHDLATDAEVVISDEKHLAMSPSISFDDRYVVYTSRVDGKWDIYRRDLVSGEIKRLTQHVVHLEEKGEKVLASNFAPTLDRHGNLLFASNRSGRFELYLLKSELFGSDEQALKVTNYDGDVYAPAVSGIESYKQNLAPEMLDPARSSFGVAVDNDRIYVVGGHQGREHTYPPESFLGKLEYFDLKSNAWKQAADRPHVSHGFEVTMYNGKLYAFGGFAYSADHKPKWKSLDVIDRYDPETNQWQTIGHMPRARSSYVLAHLGSKAYIFGGWDSTPKHENDYDGKFHREIDVFDFETGKISTISTELPDPLRRAFTGVVNGRDVYLIGGLGQGASHFDLLDKVTVFNADSEQWTEAPALPFATFAPAAAFVGRDLHVFGGMFKTTPTDYRYVSHIYRLDGGAWQHTGRYLNEAKGFARVVNASDNRVAVIGGHEYLLDGSDAPVRTMEWFEAK